MKKSELGMKIGLFSVGLFFIAAAIFSSFQNYYGLTIYVLDFLGLACVILSTVVKSSPNTRHLTVKEMSMVAVQGAISVLLYIFVKFNLPIFPSFLEIHISEIPALITSFAYGPFAGCMVIIVRYIIKLPMTSTAGVGELADFVLGLVLVIISGVIYKKKRTFKGALFGTGLGIVLSVIICCFLNWLVLIPFYLELYFGGSMDPLLGMCAMIPGINANNFMPLYIFVGVVPFNLLRYIIVFIVTFVLYKRVHFLLKKITKAK